MPVGITMDEAGELLRPRKQPRQPGGVRREVQHADRRFARRSRVLELGCLIDEVLGEVELLARDHESKPESE
jgi:hypothetical protein